MGPTCTFAAKFESEMKMVDNYPNL